MSKPSRETQLRVGEALLKQRGVAADAPIAVLQAAIGQDPAGDLAIAHRLGGIATAESADALRGIEAISSDKLVIKEIRRALYRLEQQGVTGALPEAQSKSFVLPTATADIEGYLSPPDGRGDQLIWLVKPHSGGLLHLFAVLNDPQGLKEVFAAEISRKQLRAASDDLLTKHEIRMVEAPWRYCDFTINRALEWAQARNEPVHGDYRSLRLRFTHEPWIESAAPVYEQMDADSVVNEPLWLRDSASLMQEKEFRTWFFPPEELGPYLNELMGMKDSLLVLSEFQQKERFAQTIERAVTEIFGGEDQMSWVRRFETMAYVLYKTARHDAARRAFAVALALKASANGGREIPYCEVMIRSCLATYWQMSQKQETAQRSGSLVLTPEEAAREAQTRRRP